MPKRRKKGVIEFYNPTTRLWYRARRTRRGLRIIGVVRRKRKRKKK